MNPPFDSPGRPDLRKQEAGGRRPDAGGRKQEARGSSRQEAGGGKQDAGTASIVFVIPSLELTNN
ncbi:MAG TPA: hypothetical protein VGL91_26145 [Acidobacteriota bacterium]